MVHARILTSAAVLKTKLAIIAVTLISVLNTLVYYSLGSVGGAWQVLGVDAESSEPPFRILEPQQDALFVAQGEHNGYPMYTVDFLFNIQGYSTSVRPVQLELLIKWQDDVKTMFQLPAGAQFYSVDITLNDLGSYFCDARLLDSYSGAVLASTSVSFEITRNTTHLHPSSNRRRRSSAATLVSPIGDEIVSVAYMCDVGIIGGFKLQLSHQLDRLPQNTFRTKIIDLSCIDEINADFLHHLAPDHREQVVRICLQLNSEEWHTPLAFVNAALSELETKRDVALLSPKVRKVLDPLFAALRGVDVLVMGNAKLAINASGTNAYIPLVAHILDIPVVLDLGARGPHALPESGTNAISLMIAPSAFVVDVARRHLPDTPIITIAPIINRTLFSYTRAHRACSHRVPKDGTLIVAYVGRISSEKGPGMFVRAAAAMNRHALASRIRYWMIGDGKLRQDIERLAERLLVDIKFWGFTPHKELPCLLLDVDITVMSTLIDETFGLAAFEAMLMRSVVVSFPSGGSREFLIDDKTAVVAKTQTPEAIAAAIANLVGDPERRSRIARTAQHHALVYYPSEEAEDLYARAYRWAARKLPQKFLHMEKAARVPIDATAAKWMVALSPCPNHVLVQRAYNEGSKRLWSEEHDYVVALLEKATSCNWIGICGALLNLGVAYKHAGAKSRAKDALLKAHACTEGNDFKVHAQLGTLLRQMGNTNRAELHFWRALEIEPNNVATTKALGYLLSSNARAGEALVVYDNALSKTTSPRDRLILEVLRATSTPYLYKNVDEVESWRYHVLSSLVRLARTVPSEKDIDPLVEVGVTPFQSTYAGFANRPVYEAFSSILAASSRSAEHIQWTAPPQKNEMSEMRIGILQEQPGNSSPYRLMLGWLRDARLDPDSNVQFIFLQWMPSDGSEFTDGSAMNDVMRECHHVVALPFSLAKSRRRIAALSLDVLIFPAIAASPFQVALTLTRLARVQLVFGHGHPVTSGSNAVDYFVSSDLFHNAVRPDNISVDVDADHTEQLIRFKSLSIKWSVDYMPEGIPPIWGRGDIDTSHSRRALVENIAAIFAQYGMPFFSKGARFYVCLQQKVKFHPSFDNILKGILESDERSVIILLKSTSSRVLFDRFASAGILSEGSIGRIVYLPFMDRTMYKKVLAAAHVVLDTFPWGGGVTSLEALSVCAPIVVLPSSTSVLHLTLGYYRKLGMHKVKIPKGVFIPSSRNVTAAEYPALSALLAVNTHDYVVKAIAIAKSEGTSSSESSSSSSSSSSSTIAHQSPPSMGLGTFLRSAICSRRYRLFDSPRSSADIAAKGPAHSNTNGNAGDATVSHPNNNNANEGVPGDVGVWAEWKAFLRRAVAMSDV